MRRLSAFIVALALCTAPTLALEYGMVQESSETRASKLIGSTIVNTANETIGDVNDVILDRANVKYVIIGVGGFLGIGEKNVAVPFSALKTTLEDNGSLKVSVDVTKDQLKAAPKYAYVGEKTTPAAEKKTNEETSVEKVPDQKKPVEPGDKGQ